MKTKYIVFAWLNGSDYDSGHCADFVTRVTAETLSDAESIGDRRARKAVGCCDVIMGELIDSTE